MIKKAYKKGFTLIELLVVIGILAILLAITLIAINPARQFAQANDTQRGSDVNAILNAISQYQADFNGALPAGIPIDDPDVEGSEALPIGRDADAPLTVVDLCLLVPTYLAALPVDPLTDADPIDETICTSDPAENYNTGYTVVQSSTNSRVTVSAPNAELRTPISVTR